MPSECTKGRLLGEISRTIADWVAQDVCTNNLKFALRLSYLLKRVVVVGITSTVLLTVEMYQQRIKSHGKVYRISCIRQDLILYLQGSEPYQ